ncbi:DMT family transporter [Streptomyces sp. NPDC007929]|uniref:DMT family transporter n=1 Tax=unclassified Streptomyces TaxID=2593676 RepID=UPI0036ECD5CB
MSALALSVLLSLVSAFAYAGGAIVQERVAESSPGEQYAPLRRPGWWAAVALNGLGGLLHVVALAYGPLSLVQPLGALTIVVALPMAALFVGRKAGATAWRGAIMATVGLAGLLSLVAASDARSLNTAERVAVAVVTAGVVVALMIAARAAHRHPAVRSMLLATASGIAFGMSSVFTKTVAVDWTGGVSAADVPSLAVIGVLATAGMLLSQAAYRGAGLAAPLATLTVVNPVVAAAVGITMFGETFRYGTTGTALALSCGVVAAGGLILLTTERLAQGQAEGADALPAAGPVLEAGSAGAGSDSGAGSGSGFGSGSGSGSGFGFAEVPEGVDGRSEPVADGAGVVPAGGRLLVEDVLAAGPRAGTVSAVLVPGSGAGASAAVLVPRAGAPATEVAPGSGAGAGASAAVPVLRAASGAVSGAEVTRERGEREASAQVPDDAGAVLVPGPDAVAAAAAVVASVADASYESGESPVTAATGDQRPLSYVPYYGIPYVPLPTVGRHRTRVRS